MLALGAADVALAVGLAHAGVGERHGAVDDLAARRVPDQARVGVVEREVDEVDGRVEAQLHAADGVDDALDPAEADLDEVVDANAGELFHG